MKALLLSAVQEDRIIILKFYEPITNRIILWKDPLNYKPYCYVAPESVPQIREFVGIESIEDFIKRDIRTDKDVTMSKVTCKDNFVILKNIIPTVPTWETDIRVQNSYIYDNGFQVGKWYEVKKDYIEQLDNDSEIKLDEINVEGIIEKQKFLDNVKKWAKLLDEPIPDMRRVAFDIEVESGKDSMPDPSKAEQRVTAISFCSDDINEVFVLKRPEVPEGEDIRGTGIVENIEWFDSEKTMIEQAFDIIESYPICLTYNGDTFDMPYLFNRAVHLGIENIPLKLIKTNATLAMGIHLDLYTVFKNVSLKIYAFKSKYVENGLGHVSKALLGEGKLEYEGTLDQIPLNTLAHYCFNDARLTYKLSSYNNNLVMNLLVIISRISNMSIDECSRYAINKWIKSLLYYTHRMNNELIPREFPKDEASTTAKTDKKYEGATVLVPQPGIHFNVKVMDFASLYPSIIKTKNVSYDTVNCPHEECRSNVVPFTKHHICTKKNGTLTTLIGSLKELRVGHFKKLSKIATTEDEKNRHETTSEALKVFLNACFTDDTDVLTINGIKKIKDIKVGDQLLTLNPKTLETEISPVIETQCYLYNNELVCIKNKNYDWKVTKNHRFYLHHQLNRSNKINWFEAKDLTGNYQVPLQNKIKGIYPKEIEGYPIDSLMQLLGWYISEGSLIYYSKYNSYRITITQKDRTTLEEIADLVKDCGMKPNIYTKTVEFYSEKFYKLLEQWCGKGSHDKHLPDFIWNFSSEPLEHLFRTMYLGDGTSKQPQYNTISIKLRDDIMRLCIYLGMTPHYRIDSNVWRITTNIHSRTVRNSRDITKESFNGKVYCCTTKENHIIFAGRNGKMGWTGQCYGVIGYEEFPLYYLPTAEAITSYGRDIIGKTISFAKGLGIDVLYGDTDSIFTKDPTQEQVTNLISFAKERFNIDLEQDKAYRYVILSNRKKNYFGIKSDGKADIKGLSGKKSNTPPFIRELFTEIIDNLGKVSNIEQFTGTKLYIKSRIQEVINGFGNIPLNKLVFKTMVKNTADAYKVKPNSLKAAEQISEHTHVGQFVEYIKTYGEPNVKPVQLVQRHEVNREKYLEILDTVMTQIIEPMDMDMQELLGYGHATKLSEFF